MNSLSSPDGNLMESSGEQAIGSPATSCHILFRERKVGIETHPGKDPTHGLGSVKVGRWAGSKKWPGQWKGWVRDIYNSNLPHPVARLGLGRWSRRGGTRNTYT